MRRHERPTRPANCDRSARKRRVQQLLVPLLVILAVVLPVLFARGVSAWYARQMAARQLRAGAVSLAERWLAWSAWFDPDDGRTDLMQAACFRRRQQVDRFVSALDSAVRKGTPAAQVRQERELGLVQAGKLDERPEQQIGTMLEAGLPPHDVATAFVYGFLVCDKPEEAKMVLDAWAADRRAEAQISYMTGVYWHWLGEAARAQTEFEDALALQPGHELARTNLAELLEEQVRLEAALAQYMELATRVPENELARVGVARLLRKMGRNSEARTVLESPAARSEASVALALEMAQIELESADCEKAVGWFERTDLDRTEDRGTLRAAAITFAVLQDTIRSDRLFARSDAVSGRLRRIDELRTRLAIEPSDQRAAEELASLSAASSSARANSGGVRAEAAGDDRHERPATPAAELYARHCSACHGENGHGDGRAGQHLIPRPRDLRAGKSRLASTVNGIPTLADLEAVIRRGMPGTSMPPFEKLTENERKLLAQEVRRMNQEGVRESFVAALKTAEEDSDEDEVRHVVQLHTEPGAAVRVPPIGPADAPAIARGKETYFKLGCQNCHGDDGTGARDNPLFDDQGFPALPRDLVREPFKGGQEAESVYLRIFVGMPGTVHPNSSIVPEDQLVGLVQYCRQLAREPKRVMTNYERFHQATRRGQASYY